MKTKGQATLEYVVTLVAIIAAIVVGVVVVRDKIAKEGDDNCLMGKVERKIVDFTRNLKGY